MMSQVPSERRVMTVPSGRVVLAVEKDVPSEDPAEADEPVPDADEEFALLPELELALLPELVPELLDADPVPDCMVVVVPSTVVDDVTFPPPAVTDVDVPLPVVASPWCSVQVVPSSSVTCSEGAETAIPAITTNGNARSTFGNTEFLVMGVPPERLVPEIRNQPMER
jgi:hypothetical protein